MLWRCVLKPAWCHSGRTFGGPCLAFHPTQVYSDVTNETSVHMIDFARCHRTEGVLSHRAAWQPGNHEDGYLTGLDNLVRILEALAAERRESVDSPWRSTLN